MKRKKKSFQLSLHFFKRDEKKKMKKKEKKNHIQSFAFSSIESIRIKIFNAKFIFGCNELFVVRLTAYDGIYYRNTEL